MTAEADDRTLARVRALLSRAGHPNTPEEEARTSAVIAARMIYTCGLDVRIPSTTASSEPPPPPRPPRPPSTPPSVHIITSKFQGWCKGCNTPFASGEVVAWHPGRGCTHYDCRTFWEKSP